MKEYNKEYLVNILKPGYSGSRSVYINNAGHINDKIEYLTKKVKDFLKLNNYDNELNFLYKKLGNNFNVIELYNFLFNASNYCNICGSELKFYSLNKGYLKCEQCEKNKIKELKTLNDVYDFINTNRHYTGPGFILLFKKDILLINKIKQIDNNFNINNINTIEDLYLYLNDNKFGICEVCGNKTKFLKFYSLNNRIYKQFCCDKCRNIWWQKKQHENNTCYRIKDKKMMGEKISLKLKESIKSGKFTPCVTNSWCHSKINVKFILNDKIESVNLRSSWEAYFQLLNPTIKYEELRIPYFYKNKFHTYIVDFIDYDNKIVYEIKPKSLQLKGRNKIKNIELIKWCTINNYKFKYIDEDYFKKFIVSDDLFKYMDIEYKDKLIKFLKRYNFFNYEN